MIEIVLDTNIYRSNPMRDNLIFNALERLSKSNNLRLHIPYIVEREFQTQQRETYSKSIDAARSALNTLSKKVLLKDIHPKVNELKIELEKQNQTFLDQAESEFVEWAENLGAVRHPICIFQTNAALEAYFKGDAPLKSPKTRADIPDSFLVQAIKMLHEKFGTIYIVAEDKKVRDSFSTTNDVFIYENLHNFIDSELIQNILTDLDLQENINSVKQAISEFENEYAEISSKIASDIGEKLLWGTISSPSIPDDNNEATIDGFYAPEDIIINFDELTYYGDGEFGVPFSLRILVTGFYYIYKPDYYCLDAAEDSLPTISEHNNHYFEAESEFEVLVRGITSIKIDRSKVNLEDMSECIEPSSIAIDQLDSVEIN